MEKQVQELMTWLRQMTEQARVQTEDALRA